MGEARGRIIILQNCISPLCGIGETALDVHDEWEVPTIFYVNERWARLEHRLQLAKERELHSKLFLTFCSGHGWLVLSESVATWMNSYLYSYLESQVNEKTRLGVLIVDFPGAELVQLVIQCNEGV